MDGKISPYSLKTIALHSGPYTRAHPYRHIYKPEAETYGLQRGTVPSNILGGGPGAAYISQQISEIFNKI